MTAPGISENTKQAIWKYLQLILITIMGNVKSAASFGDTAGLFEGIEEEELQKKLGETIGGLTDFFKGLSKDGSTENMEKAFEEMFSSEGPEGTEGTEGTPEEGVPEGDTMPNADDLHNHLKSLFDGKIGTLAKELAEEMSGEVMDLFRTRGFGLVVNEDLVLPALRIACLVPACIAAITGGALSYVGTTQLAPADRGTLAGIAAFLSFLMGFALCSVLSGVIASGVKTIFVAFALNPGALGVTHPEALGKLVAAWNAAYPEEFRASGHDAYFGSGGNRAYAVPNV